MDEYTLPQAAITVRHLSSSYENNPVLRDICLDLYAGELFCLLGPNGSGKSTLLAQMAGIAQPGLQVEPKSLIKLGSKEISGYSRKELSRLVAWSAQTENPVWDYTVAETVLMGRYAHTDWTGSYTANDHERVRIIIEENELSHLAHRGIHQLSGGEFRRVLLARLLAQEASVLVLDEPVASLDIRHQYAILNKLRSLAHDKKLAIIVSLHDLNLASLFADRMALLSEGKLVKTGLPAEILQPEILKQVYALDFDTVEYPERKNAKLLVVRQSF